MAHLANSVFANDSCNAYAMREFPRAVNQLDSTRGRAHDEHGIFRGKPSPSGDWVCENDQKQALGRKNRPCLQRSTAQEVTFALTVLRKTAFEQPYPGTARRVGAAFVGRRHLIEFRAPLTNVATGGQPRQFERFAARNRDLGQFLCRDGTDHRAQQHQHVYGDWSRHQDLPRELYKTIIEFRAKNRGQPACGVYRPQNLRPGHR